MFQTPEIHLCSATKANKQIVTQLKSCCDEWISWLCLQWSLRDVRWCDGGMVYNENSLTVSFRTRTMIYNTKTVGLKECVTSILLPISLKKCRCCECTCPSLGPRWSCYMVRTQVNLSVLLYEMHKGQQRTHAGLQNLRSIMKTPWWEDVGCY